MYTAEARASALQEWETVEVEDHGGSGAEHVPMVGEEPTAGPFASFADTFNFFK